MHPPEEAGQHRVPGVRAISSENLVRLLELRAEKDAKKRAFTFLIDGEDAEAHLSYGELLEGARRIASQLQACTSPGDRAVLLYPPGLDYIMAFFGCLAARVIAVPAYPPDPGRLNASLPRLRAIIEDARPKVVLTNTMIMDARSMVLSLAPDLARLSWVATDAGDGDASAWQRPDVAPEHLAFLQYTSGSTAAPKGVMLSHRSILHNLAVIQRGMRLVSGVSSGVGWLPPYHDMGLIGKILQPVYADIPCTLMSPLDFLQQPFRWLRAISNKRATCSGGPNFAYDLCVRRITPEQRATLDLSSWEVAFNGAEPLRADTMRRFAETFGPCGFQPKALYPCYGLAESTLMCTGSENPFPLVRSFDRAGLEQHQAVPRDGSSTASVELVSSGRPYLGMEIAIVTDGVRCAERTIGEIWVHGQSIASGYWSRPDDSERAFRAKLDGKEWLRTGDLGFEDGGELFVTGRIKDLIIIKGRKLHPQDLELSAERSHPAIRPGCSAAFVLEARGEEQVALVAELDERRGGNPDEVLAAMRGAIAEVHQVPVERLVLIRSRSIPKTSSGKIQRFAVKAALLDGTLEEVAAWSAPVPALGAS